MAPTCRIYPRPVCFLTMDKGLFTYLNHQNYGVMITIPVYVWLIETERGPILVDTGCTADEFRRYTLFAREIKDSIAVEEALKEHGYAISDITTIILTHLDGDHLLNARKFVNARIILQEDEYRFARSPHPLFSKKYRHQHLYNGINFHLIKGEFEVVPGVRVIHTPGHTAGGQSVLVTTPNGRIAISGQCTIDENLAGDTIIAPGMNFNPIQAYDSLKHLKQAADVVIPLHSESYVNVGCIS